MQILKARQFLKMNSSGKTALVKAKCLCLRHLEALQNLTSPLKGREILSLTLLDFCSW